MKDIFATFVLIVVVVGAGLVHAQGALWTHPQGLYSLDIWGWRQVTLEPGARELAIFAPAAPQTASRRCFVLERTVPTMANRSQDQLNAFSASYVPTAAGNGAIANLRQLTIDGVVVSAFVRSNFERRTVAAIRVFALSPSGTVAELSCRGVEPLTEADRAEFERTLDSLHFRLRDATP